MGDVAKGIRSFRKGMADDEATPGADPKSISAAQASEETTKDKTTAS